MKLTTIQIALIAVFAALQATLSIFPFSFTIGVSGRITLGVIGGPLIGIIIGPFIGGLSVLVGSTIGLLLEPSGAIFGPLTVIPPLLGAVSAGLVKIKKGYLAGMILASFIALFYAHPFGRESLMFPWLHIITMIIAISPLAYYAGSSFKSSQPTRSMLTFGLLISIFIGIMTDHMSGSAIAIWYLSPILTPPIWFSIMFIYPVERLVATFLTYIIVAPTYYGLRKAGFIDIIKSTGQSINESA